MNSQPRSHGFLQAFDEDYFSQARRSRQIFIEDGGYESHVGYGYTLSTLHIVNVCFLL